MAAAAAFGMQEAKARVGQIVTPGGTVVQLALKVAVACGEARRAAGLPKPVTVHTLRHNSACRIMPNLL